MSIEITGLTTKCYPPDLGCEAPLPQDEKTVDPTAMLSQAMDSGRYKEIDLALQPTAAPSEGRRRLSGSALRLRRGRRVPLGGSQTVFRTIEMIGNRPEW